MTKQFIVDCLAFTSGECLKTCATEDDALDCAIRFSQESDTELFGVWNEDDGELLYIIYEGHPYKALPGGI